MFFSGCQSCLLPCSQPDSVPISLCILLRKWLQGFGMSCVEAPRRGGKWVLKPSPLEITPLWRKVLSGFGHKTCMLYSFRSFHENHKNPMHDRVQYSLQGEEGEASWPPKHAVYLRKSKVRTATGSDGTWGGVTMWHVAAAMPPVSRITPLWSETDAGAGGRADLCSGFFLCQQPPQQHPEQHNPMPLCLWVRSKQWAVRYPPSQVM